MHGDMIKALKGKDKDREKSLLNMETKKKSV